MVLVVILPHSVLGSFEVLLAEFVDSFHFQGEIAGVWVVNSSVDARGNCKDWMETIEGKEWGDASRGMDGVIVGELRER